MNLTKVFRTPVSTQQFSVKYCLLNGQEVSSEAILLESLQKWVGTLWLKFGSELRLNLKNNLFFLE